MVSDINDCDINALVLKKTHFKNKFFCKITTVKQRGIVSFS